MATRGAITMTVIARIIATLGAAITIAVIVVTAVVFRVISRFVLVLEGVELARQGVVHLAPLGVWLDEAIVHMSEIPP